MEAMRIVERAAGPDALLVIALWWEKSGVWRIRVSRSTHLVDGEPERSYVATRAEVLRVVEEWLDGSAVTEP